MSSTLLAYFFAKSGVNTLSVVSVLFATPASITFAARWQFALVASTVTDRGPVTWFAPHLLAHMNTSGVQVSPTPPVIYPG